METNQNILWRYLTKPVHPDTARMKRAAGLCKHWGCKRKSRPGGLDCEVCKARKARLRHPVRFAYRDLRTNARRRGVPFTLTLEQFRELVGGTQWEKRRGRNPDSLTIDRIDPSLGYEPGNVRLLTHQTNSVREYDPEAEARADEESELWK